MRRLFCVFLFATVWPHLVARTIPSGIALLMMDVQNCFMPGGTLTGPDFSHSERIIPVINEIRANHERRFSLVVNVQDWHCKNDVAFASQYEGKKAYDIITLKYNANG